MTGCLRVIYHVIICVTYLAARSLWDPLEFISCASSCLTSVAIVASEVSTNSGFLCPEGSAPSGRRVSRVALRSAGPTTAKPCLARKMWNHERKTPNIGDAFRKKNLHLWMRKRSRYNHRIGNELSRGLFTSKIYCDIFKRKFKVVFIMLERTINHWPKLISWKKKSAVNSTIGKA